MIKYLFFTLSIVFLVKIQLGAQNRSLLDNTPLLKKYLKQSFFDIDSQANAVILYEETVCNYSQGSYDFSYEVIAKILNKAAIDDLALVNILKRSNTTFLNASGETYNLENDNIVVTKLNKDDILKDRLDDKIKVTKFILPNVKVGSLVHYSYKIHKSAVAKIPDWNFQSDYPTLISKFTLQVPKNFSYNKIVRSHRPFLEVTKDKMLDTCDACEYSPQYDGESRLISWSIRNVPAFENEPFSSSADNFKERLRIMITDVYLNSGGKMKLYNNWDDYSKEYLLKSSDFIGQAFNANGFLDETVAALTTGLNSDLDKAKAIYKFVQQQIAAVDFDDDEENIKAVLTNKKGDIYGVNLLLIALLKKAKLNCEPIVLSTKTNERLNSDYPNPYAINYVVGLFKDNDRAYYLDAAGALLPFGILLPKCYNGYARVVSKKGTSVTLSPDSITEKSLSIVNITPSENQQDLIVNVDRTLGVFGSINYRSQWRGDKDGAIERLSITLQLTIKN